MSYEQGYISAGAGYGSAGQSTGPKTNSVTPVTLRLLHTIMPTEHDKAKIGEHELKLVTFVGYVLQYENEMKQCYVEDGSGVISVLVPDTTVEGELKDYVRFTGHVQWSKNAYSAEMMGRTEGPVLRAYKARQITDHNELSYHILDVVTTYERLQKGTSSAGSMSSYMGMPASTYGGEAMSEYSYHPSAAGGEAAEFASAAESAKQSVLDQFQKQGKPSLAFTELVAGLAGRFSEGEVRKACVELQASGHALTDDGGETYMFVE